MRKRFAPVVLVVALTGLTMVFSASAQPTVSSASLPGETDGAKPAVTATIPSGPYERLFMWPSAEVLEGPNRVRVDAPEAVRALAQCDRWMKMILAPEWLPDDDEEVILLREEFEGRDTLRMHWEKNGYEIQLSQTRTVFTVKLTLLDGRDTGDTNDSKVREAREVCLKIFTPTGIRYSSQGERIPVKDLPAKIVSFSFLPDRIKYFEDGSVRGTPELDRPANDAEVLAENDENWHLTPVAYMYWFHKVSWYNDGRSIGFALLKTDGGPLIIDGQKELDSNFFRGVTRAEPEIVTVNSAIMEALIKKQASVSEVLKAEMDAGRREELQSELNIISRQIKNLNLPKDLDAAKPLSDLLSWVETPLAGRMLTESIVGRFPKESPPLIIASAGQANYGVACEIYLYLLENGQSWEINPRDVGAILDDLATRLGSLDAQEVSGYETIIHVIKMTAVAVPERAGTLLLTEALREDCPAQEMVFAAIFTMPRVTADQHSAGVAALLNTMKELSGETNKARYAALCHVVGENLVGKMTAATALASELQRDGCPDKAAATTTLAIIARVEQLGVLHEAVKAADPDTAKIFEVAIERLENQIPELDQFVIPGDSPEVVRAITEALTYDGYHVTDCFEPDRALSAYRKTLQLRPKSPGNLRIYFYMVQLLTCRKGYGPYFEEGKKICADALEAFPIVYFDTMWLAQLNASMLNAQGRESEALEALSPLLDMDESDVQLPPYSRLDPDSPEGKEALEIERANAKRVLDDAKRLAEIIRRKH